MRYAELCVRDPNPEVMSVIRQCYERMSEDCERITCSVKIDARSGEAGRLTGKVEKIESLLGREVRK